MTSLSDEKGFYLYFLAVVGINPKTDLSHSRCWGWFRSFEEAEEVILNNSTDIEEAGYYKWAVIERIHEGVMGCAIPPVQWYHFKRRDESITGFAPDNITAEKIDCPERFSHEFGFSGVG